MPQLVYQGTWPDWYDSEEITLQKILQTGGGGSGGTGSVYYGTWADPNGNQSATRPAFYYNDIGGVWEKTGAGTNNTGWTQIIA